MSFFISLLHRVNFSVYSRSVFPCFHLLPGGLAGSYPLTLGQESFGRLGSFLGGLRPNTRHRVRWGRVRSEPEITQLSFPPAGRLLGVQTLLRPHLLATGCWHSTSQQWYLWQRHRLLKLLVNARRYRRFIRKLVSSPDPQPNYESRRKKKRWAAIEWVFRCQSILFQNPGPCIY